MIGPITAISESDVVHVVGVSQGNELALYIGGVADGDRASAVYGRALTPMEVRRIADAGSAGKCKP